MKRILMRKISLNTDNTKLQSFLAKHSFHRITDQFCFKIVKEEKLKVLDLWKKTCLCSSYPVT